MQKVFSKILLIVMLPLVANSCFAQDILKFEVKESYLRDPNNTFYKEEAGYKEEADWYYFGDIENYFITIDLANNKLVAKINDRINTFPIYFISSKNISGDSVDIKFYSLQNDGQRVENRLYKSRTDKNYTLITTTKDREDKRIMTYLSPES